MEKHDETTKQINPTEFVDWEGETRVIKSKKIKKSGKVIFKPLISKN